ncbi:MAG: adenosylcobinamide-phosphate synthase CbiB [Candidatus Promineifilaceae bacterium]
MRVILLSLVLDALLGDPPNRWHPTAWMGTLIMTLRKQTPETGRFLFGGLITFGGGALVWGIGRIILTLIHKLPAPLNLLCESAILNFTFSLNGLTSAGRDVQRALNDKDLPEARRLLSWHLVSRDTSDLSAGKVSAATIQSVAENFSDSVVAPLFFYQLGGLPAALAYRYLNTCDAMLGYRDAEREWLGKIPARLDDVANLIPARLSAISILTIAPFKLAWEPAIKTYRSDANTTDSPNAGQPMAAAAGTLQVRLQKIGHYDLGRNFREPNAHDIGRGIRVIQLATLVTLPLLWLMKRNSDQSPSITDNA